MKVFVDANVFLRFLVSDDARQATQAEALFVAAKTGKVQLTSGPPVLFELAWTLRSAYGQSRTQVLDTLQSLLGMAGMRFLDEDRLSEALSLAQEHGMEFADAYIAASAGHGKSALATFNAKDFKKAGSKLWPW